MFSEFSLLSHKFIYNTNLTFIFLFSPYNFDPCWQGFIIYLIIILIKKKNYLLDNHASCSKTFRCYSHVCIDPPLLALPYNIQLCVYEHRQRHITSVFCCTLIIDVNYFWFLSHHCFGTRRRWYFYKRPGEKQSVWLHVSIILFLTAYWKTEY